MGYKNAHLLEANSLWEVIEAKTVMKNKDQKAFSIIYGPISDDVLAQLDNKLTVKETWMILKVKNLGAAYVQKARVHTLEREFELLMKREDEPVTDFARKFSTIVTQLKAMG
ncbi:uncharacterized protein LOC144711406 [Wolffia australiana]